jgi:long-chain fatty acid transport protein
MKRLYLTIALFCLSSTFSFAQNGIRLIDFNAQSLGRGGTSIAVFDNASLQLTNPAGLAFLTQKDVDVNFSFMSPSLHFKNSINDVDGESNLFPLPSAAFVIPELAKNWTLGIGFFTTGGMGADFNLNHTLYTDQNGSYIQQKYHSMLATMQGGLSVAYKFNEQLSVGLTTHIVYSMMEFQMPYSLNPLAMQGQIPGMNGMTFGQLFAAAPAQGGFGYTEVTASANMSELSAMSFNGRIGIAYKVNDQLNLGFNYTLPTSVNFTGGKANMDMTQQLNHAFGLAMMGYMAQNPSATQAEAQGAVMQNFTNMGIDMAAGVIADYDLEVELAYPQTFGLGIGYQLNDKLLIAADFEYLDWSNAFDKMTLKLSNGTSANINTMMGNSGEFDMNFPLNWENSMLMKVGLEYLVNESLTARAGYMYGSNPVPSSTIFPVFPAIVEQHITLGASYALNSSININAAWEMGFNNAQTADATSLIANEYNSSTSELATQFAHISFSYRF